MPTIEEIANRAGVSISSAWRVLNQKDGVSEKMRQCVLKAANELETTKDANPKNSYSIAFVHHPYQASFFFRELFEGIQSAADRYGLQLRLISLPQVKSERFMTHPYFQEPSLRPDGVIFYADVRRLPNLIEQLNDQDIFCLQVGYRADRLHFPYVAPDDVDAGRQAANHLLGLGHTRIGFVGYRDEIAYQDRFQGYQEALAAHGIEPVTHWIIDGAKTAYDREGMEKSVNDLLECAPEITGIIFANNFDTEYALPPLKAAGFVIPDDLSVVVLDDAELERTFDPPLTAMAFPIFEEGFWAVKMLFEHMQEPQIKSYHIAFRATLMRRESCIPPKDG
jgi:LacI family transcriptional regulator